jgi:uncharacterized membrane protein YgdD (TMEM256/DUF423 family)
MSQRNILAGFGAIMGFLLMVAGAYGAHVSGGLSTAGWALFMTAWVVHGVHALAALTIGLLRGGHPLAFSIAGWMIGAGGGLFALSIYSRIFFSFSLGPVTPVFGVVAMAGWLLAAFILLKKQATGQ